MKTTVLGILTILVAVGSAAVSFIKTGTFDIATTTTSVSAGIGLIHAKDAAPKPTVSGIVRLAPLAWFFALGLALLGLASCTVVTAPDGTVTMTPDKGLIQSGFDYGFRLLDRFKPDPVPVAAPVVTPAK